MRISKIINFSSLLLIIFGYHNAAAQTVSASDSKITPVQFFIGKTSSSGAVENRKGKPTTNITTNTIGVLKDSILSIEQDLFPEGGKKNHRSWQIKQIDKTHVIATANDIDGAARGLLNGNQFSWTFRLKLQNRKFIKHARMTQYYYLMPDGQTMIIRSIIRKFSFTVAQITEEFRRS